MNTTEQKETSFWENIPTSTGESLSEVAEKQPVLLVFLRHFGCSFCREAISDLSKLKKRLEQKNVRIVLVHLSNDAKIAEQFFKKYKLWPVTYIDDPERHIYASFGLGRGTPQQLFGLMNWIRGFQAGVIEGHGFAYQGEEMGDGFQMPGIFVLHQGKIINSFIHQSAWDRPDYEQIVSYCIP